MEEKKIQGKIAEKTEAKPEEKGMSRKVCKFLG